MLSVLPPNSKILIVDDEEIVRDVTAMMIEDLGATALGVADGNGAIELFKQHRKDIPCVVVDFSMAGLNGYETCIALRAIDPSVGIVMASGLTVVPEVESMRLAGEIEFLSKPYEDGDLVAAIKRSIARRKAK